MAFTRVKNNKPAGNYTSEFLAKNTDKVINGELVSEWDIVTLYNGSFISPFWNGSKWVESATPEEIISSNQSKEYNLYLKRQSEGVRRYLNLAAEFRVKKLDGQITDEFHKLIENTLKPVRDEFVNGQFITSIEKLEEIGSDIITQSIYDQIHLSITEAINEFYT